MKPTSKTFISLLSCLFVINVATAQIYTSLSTEVINSTVGSTDTDSRARAHLLLKLGVVSVDHVRVGVNIEYLHNSYYHKFAFEVGRRLYIGPKIEIIPTINFGFINRDGDALFTHGVGLETNYPITKKLGVSFNLTLSSRADLDLLSEMAGNARPYNYRANAFIGLVYEIVDPANKKP